MDKEDALNIAIKYAYAVKSKYDFVKIILFGSYAKGNYNQDSDIEYSSNFKGLYQPDGCTIGFNEIKEKN